MVQRRGRHAEQADAAAESRRRHEPLRASDLYPIFAEALADQEMNQTDAWIDIPEAVREQYKNYRCTPLVRAYELEKAFGTPAHIYFKNESVSPGRVAQAEFGHRAGLFLQTGRAITNITTETGAGQWGAALSYAAKAFGLELAVYMVKISYEQKPYRRSIMQTFGAQVTASPSMSTKAGRKILTDHPNYQGSLGTAISEAIELAMSTPNCKYTLGSVLSHVTLHQTIIGLEAEKQMAMAGEYPDIDDRLFRRRIEFRRHFVPVHAAHTSCRRQKDALHRRRTRTRVRN